MNADESELNSTTSPQNCCRTTLRNLNVHTASQKAIPLIATDVIVMWSVRLYVSVYVTLVHPAKAVGLNEITFGRDTRVVPSNTVLDRGPGILTFRGDLGVETPSSQRCRLSPNNFGLVIIIIIIIIISSSSCITLSTAKQPRMKSSLRHGHSVFW